MRRRRTLVAVGLAILFILVFFVLASTDANKELNHDEHQFIASAVLASRCAAVPYKSYPYFHLPNLVVIYALLFRTTSYLLLATRLFSAACATITLALIFLIAFHLCEEWSYQRRLLMAVGSVVLMLASPFFAHASGFGWNHDLPVLLTLIAYLLHCQIGREIRSSWWIVVSGGLLGFAAGTRLSFAPAVLPFVVAIWFFPSVTEPKTKLRMLSMFIAGAALAVLPIVILFASAPRQFIFGNLRYPRLNTLYRFRDGYQTAMSFKGKLAYMEGLLEEPATLLLLLLFLLVMLQVGRAKMLASNHAFEFLFSISVALFLLVGAFAPTPSFYQYFYSPIPFVIVGILCGIALTYRAGQPARMILAVFGCVVVVSGIVGLRQRRKSGLNLSPGTWNAVQIHRTGETIKGYLGEGKVLTLAPIFPLEGGLEIYPAFVTGPFAWRVAPLVSHDDRQALGLISADDLAILLSNDPPKGILIGLEGDLEQPLVDYASANGYEPQKLSNGLVLWIARPSKQPIRPSFQPASWCGA